MRVKLILGICLMVNTGIFTGCTEKGCTDEAAYNYNVLATKDDGSCKYCNQTKGEIANKVLYLVDYNSSSPFYNQPVVKFTLKQYKTQYNDGNCGDDNCSIDAEMTNLTDTNIIFNYRVSLSGSSFSFLSVSENDENSIPASETLVHTNLKNQFQSTTTCSLISSSSSSSVTTNFGNIRYE